MKSVFSKINRLMTGPENGSMSPREALVRLGIGASLLGIGIGNSLYQWLMKLEEKTNEIFFFPYEPAEPNPRLGYCDETVLHNLDSIMAVQEEKLGIHYSGHPEIKFELPEEERNIAFIRDYFAGLYKNEIIYLNIMLIRNNLDPKEVVAHELGHFYADKLHKSWGLGEWPQFLTYNDGYMVSDFDYAKCRNASLNIVSEGIAMYFVSIIDSFYDPSLPALVLPKTCKDFNFESKYALGYLLVQPILDSYNKEGIEYLVLNQPIVDELFSLPAYQQRFLEDLSGEDCKLSLWDDETPSKICESLSTP